ncbi:MAG: C4-dicarboxylate transporter DcuC [Sporomusaceae bacterium]|nr:C4-dicarboxylate transporter DcuC [Sporomusaceae bacterium]
MFIAIGLIILLITAYLLIKQYETRMVLFVSGLAMAIIAGNPMAAFTAFSTAMKNANLIEPIVAAMGFAAVLQITKCDQHLIHLLAKGLKRVGPAIIPGAVLATALVNTSITSAAGCSAAVGAILIPVLIGAGVHPAIAATAIFAGTYGSPMLNPGFGQIAIISEAARTGAMDVISNHAQTVMLLAVIAAASLTIVSYVLKEHKGYVPDESSEIAEVKISYIKALVPMLPLVLLLLGSTNTVPVMKKLAISHAMIIGVLAALFVSRMSPGDISKAFFKGFGDGFSQVFGIIAMSLVFVAGMNSLGIIKAMIAVMIENPAIAKISATFGPFLLAVICGSGEAASIAFNQTVTVNASNLGLNALDLGSLAAISGALGRTMSPIAGAAIICAGFAKISPLELAKRNAPGMVLAAIVTMAMLMA